MKRTFESVKNGSNLSLGHPKSNPSQGPPAFRRQNVSLPYQNIFISSQNDEASVLHFVKLSYQFAKFRLFYVFVDEEPRQTDKELAAIASFSHLKREKWGEEGWFCVRRRIVKRGGVPCKTNLNCQTYRWVSSPSRLRRWRQENENARSP